MNGAQGRDRTTDTAIFSRMLYQLSYLGTSSRGGLGAAVYSQAEGPCPPRFARGRTRSRRAGARDHWRPPKPLKDHRNKRIAVTRWRRPLPCGLGSRRNSKASGSSRHPCSRPNRRAARPRWKACRRSGSACRRPCFGALWFQEAFEQPSYLVRNTRSSPENQ